MLSEAGHVKCDTLATTLREIMPPTVMVPVLQSLGVHTAPPYTQACLSV